MNPSLSPVFNEAAMFVPPPFIAAFSNVVTLQSTIAFMAPVNSIYIMKINGIGLELMAIFIFIWNKTSKIEKFNQLLSKIRHQGGDNVLLVPG